MKKKPLFNLLVLLTFLVFLQSVKSEAAPWPGFGATQPSHEYLQEDSEGDFYIVRSEKLATEIELLDRDKIKSFRAYEEPNFEEGLSYENPFSYPAYDKYELVIVINSNLPSLENPDGQKMRVYLKDKGLVYYWGISTGMDAFSTGAGQYSPKSFSPRHWSGAYDVPMFWSVFFSGGKALHSTLDTESLKDLGVRKSSHGCVHIEEHRAEVIYNLIGQIGKRKTRIIVK